MNLREWEQEQARQIDYEKGIIQEKGADKLVLAVFPYTIKKHKTYYRKLLLPYLDRDSANTIVSFIMWNDIKIGDYVDVKDTVYKWYRCLVTDVTKTVEDTIVSIHYIGWASKWRESLSLNNPRLQYHGLFSSGIRIPYSINIIINKINIQIGQYICNNVSWAQGHQVSGRVVNINENYMILDYYGEIRKINYSEDDQWYTVPIHMNYTCSDCGTFYRQIDCYCKKCGSNLIV